MAAIFTEMTVPVHLLWDLQRRACVTNKHRNKQWLLVLFLVTHGAPLVHSRGEKAMHSPSLSRMFPRFFLA